MLCSAVLATEDHLGVDLVGDDKDSVLRCDFSELAESLRRPDDAGRVVRIRKDEQFGLLVDDALQMLEIHLVPCQTAVRTINRDQRILYDLIAESRWDEAERMVDRRLCDDFVALAKEALDDETDTSYDTRNEGHVLRINLPSMYIFDPLTDSLEVILRYEAVSENRMLHPLFQSVCDEIRGSEIHVRYPERDEISGFLLVDDVVFHTVGAVSFYQFVEIVHFYRCYYVQNYEYLFVYSQVNTWNNNLLSNMANSNNYDWKFVNIGGMTRVNIETGEDVKHLPELDQKLWTVLSCPTTGLEFDPATLAMLDSDKDGKIRVNEILAASQWLTKVINDAELLVKGDAVLPLSAINAEDEEGKALLASASKILENLGKADATAISVADTSDSVAIFAKTRFNGDGIITPDSTDDADLKAVIENAIKTVGSSTDRSGAAGINADQLEAFYAACTDYAAWLDAAEAGKAEIYPYGENTEAALAACEALKAKISDYFLRCKLAAFKADSSATLDVSVERIGTIAAKDLNTCVDEIASYPLSHIAADEKLAYDGINPAWKAAFASLRTLVLDVEYPEATAITEAEWNAVLAKFGAYTAWKGAKAGAVVEPLGADVVKAVVAGARKAELVALIEEDKKLEAEANSIDAVNKLTHLYRDFFKLLQNYVTMSDFFQTGEGSPLAVFQSGCLYIEQRRLDLCIRVADMGKHGDMAAQSGMFIVYCTCTSKTKGTTVNIAAVLTDGDVDGIRVGQNAVYYDRDGVDFDAVVTKIVDNPVSIRQAFWSPYRKMANAISARISKSAAEKDSKVSADLTSKANTVNVPKTEEEKAAAQAAAPKAPFDIAKFAGIFAAVGMAAGLLGSALTALVKPWYTIFFVFLALILVISGPSMFLAWLKLRKRNLAPVLNANGWAINSKVLVNTKFGATLTELAKYPKVAMPDPYAPKMSVGKKILLWLLGIIVVAGVAFGILWKTNNLKFIGIDRTPVEEVVAEEPTEAPADAETATIDAEPAAEEVAE